MITSIRVLPCFREAPYPRVVRYAQMVYVGLALAFIILLANINAWYRLALWARWLQYGLFYGGVALLLVEYYSDFSVQKKEIYWRYVYALVVAWIFIGVFLESWNILIALYKGELRDDLYHNSVIDWGAVGLYALMVVLA